MKRHSFALAFLAIFALSSCQIVVNVSGKTNETTAAQDTTPTTNEDSTTEDQTTTETTTTTTSDDSTTVEVKQGLNVEVSPNLFYYQYDHLDFSDLVVNEYRMENGKVIFNRAIDDYILTWTHNGEEVNFEERLMNEGEFAIEVSKDGFTSSEIPISVDKCTSFNQTIQLTAPTKLNYHVGDALDFTGLQVQLITKKTAYSKSDANYSEFIDFDDLTIKVGNENYSSTYTCSTAGSVKVSVSYQGYEKELSAFFTINISDSTFTPISYDDDTIVWNEDSNQMQVTISNPTKSNTDKGYYSPEEVVIESDMDWLSKHAATGKVNSPTKGDTPFLIVPVVFPGEEAQMTEDNWSKIHKAFFGNSDSLHFESLHSYYYKSSFGQLNITGNVTDYFQIKGYNGLPTKVEEFTDNHITTIVQYAWTWAQEKYNITPTDYDSNADGYLDGMWLVRMSDKVDSTSNLLWAFNHSTSQTGNINSPTTNNYGWIPFPFLEDSQYGSEYQSRFVNHECDAHVCIHETGHMLGLADYYSYSYSGYAPMGGFDMMDQNYGDHNPYSKMLYNWITPYVVTGNCTITIPSCQKRNALIVIPYNDKTLRKNSDNKYVFNPFDEYLVLDLYNNLNLYEQGYDCYNQSPIETVGGRIYHVDGRLMLYSGGALSMCTDPDAAARSTGRYSVFRGISNSEAGERAENKYDTSLPDSANAWDEIRLISADKRMLSNQNKALASSFFQKGSTFSLSSYSAQFNNSEFNCGKTFSYSIHFDSIA